MLIQNNDTNCNCYRQCTRFHILIIILLVATLSVAIRIGCRIEAIEALKVGGEENWNKLEKIMESDMYREQYAQSIDLMFQEINKGSEENLGSNNQEIWDTNNSEVLETEETTTTGVAVQE